MQSLRSEERFRLFWTKVVRVGSELSLMTQQCDVDERDQSGMR